MTVTRDKRKLWNDGDVTERHFEPGDEGLILNTSKPNKMSVKWIGARKSNQKFPTSTALGNFPVDEKNPKYTM